MRRLFAALALMAGCDGSGTSSALEWEIDCYGMSFANNVWITGVTPVLTPSDEGLRPRCQFLASHTITAGQDLEVVTGQLPEPGTVDIVNVLITAGEQRFENTRGTIHFDTFDWSRASGTYDVTGVPEGGTDEARLFGRFDWCWTSTRDDCPYLIGSGDLARDYTLKLPFFDERQGFVSGCRMLVDPTTSALQVDVQLGTWDGQSVGQLWTNECSLDGAIPPMPNRFTFKAGGVTGPGAYGPHAVMDLGGVRLPSLEGYHPMTFVPGLGSFTACELYRVPATITSQLGGSCTWEVDAEDERFRVDCSQVHHYSQPSIVSIDTVGDVHLDVACTYIEQPS